MSSRLATTRALATLVLTLLLSATLALAQGGGTSASIGGLVVDDQGGVIPGADVLVKNNATGATFRAVTDSTGRFTIPSVSPGPYTVTVSLMGFKTAVAPDVQVVTATPASVKLTLAVGDLSETVIVQGATELVQTQNAAVQTTIAVKQIESLPLVTRTALDYVVALPGVQTTGTNSRGSTINGLPSVSINITLDGVNVQDNNNRNGDGFFMYIRPMLDSVEEITVSTSTPGAESAGQGASQIRMTTRSGTNRFSGSAYNTWRNQAGTNDADVTARQQQRGWLWRLNTPYYFNKRDQPKTAAGDYFIDDVRLQTPGFRVGGPIVKDKLFYFFNWEWFLWPNQVSRTWYLLNTDAQQGLFTYTANDGTRRSVNLLQIAAANSQTSTVDPTIGKLLADIRSAASTQGGIDRYDDWTDAYTYSPGGNQKRHFPTLRMDYNITQNHRASYSFRYNRFDSNPDILNTVENRFPGFPNAAGQYSDRVMWQATMRSTFGKNIVNEGRFGYSGAFGQGSQFYPEVNANQFGCSGLGCQPATWFMTPGGTQMSGAALAITSATTGITNATSTTGLSTRYTPNWVLEDTLSWLKGKHTVAAGFSYTYTKTENWNDTVVPTVTFGLSTQDPAYSMLTATNANTFPGGISNTQAGYARSLYAVLTGRIAQIQGNAFLNSAGQYEFLGDRWQLVSQKELGLFVNDSWRVKPTLTLTAGVRYELQLPFRTDGNTYSRLATWDQIYGVTGQGNMFNPGTMTGSSPMLENYPQGVAGWNTDRNNFAPSVGVAWRPHLKNAFLAKILSADPVFRGGYSVTYSRYATQDFINIFGNNPGYYRSATRTETSGTPVIGYDGFPVLLRDSAKIYPSSFPVSPTYPFAPANNEGVYTVQPDITVPYTHQYSFGWSREIGKSMGLEVRYVGNKYVGDWTTWNLNNNANWNILENGFYDEFRKAQANLVANLAAGRGNTFAYTGAPGTSPLPIFMAYFHGIPLNDARNQDPARYTHANFKNSSWYNNLRMYAPAITTTAGTGTTGLQQPGLRANAQAAGLPANFFQTNPDQYQAVANLLMNGGNTRYDGIQIDLTRRMSKGLLVAASYTGVLNRKAWNWRSLRESWSYVDTVNGPAHAFKVNWVYELPFGQGRTFGSNASKWVNYAIGGWEFDGQLRIQSGQRFNLGNFRLVGLNDQELQNIFQLRSEWDEASGKERWYMWPKEFIENSVIALSQASATTGTGYSGTLPTGRYLAPASSPECVQYLGGQCEGTALTRIITGPIFQKYDFSFVKRFSLGGRKTIEARMDIFNVFDHINFNPVAVPGTTSTYTNWQITSAARDLNASQDAGGRITSFGLRFSW